MVILRERVIDRSLILFVFSACLNGNEMITKINKFFPSSMVLPHDRPPPRCFNGIKSQSKDASFVFRRLIT